MGTIQSRLVSFFLWLMKYSLKSEFAYEMTGGHACLGLCDDIVLCGVERFVERISQGSGTEYRLNNAGLKLYIDINQGLRRVKVRIGGDQAKDYPTFVEAVAQEIRRRELDETHYYTAGSIR